MSPWLQALLLGVVGVVFYLVMIKRLRKRHWPKAPKVVLPVVEDEPDADAGTDNVDDTKS